MKTPRLESGCRSSRRQECRRSASPGICLEWMLTLPTLLWLLVFFALPTVLILVFAFRPSDLRGGVAEGWTLETVATLGDPAWLPVLWQTLWLSAACTLICLLLALPMSWWMARLPEGWKNVLLLLVVIPFLTNFLIRVFAWKTLLHPAGPVRELLLSLHLISADTLLLNNPGTVLLVLVHTQLPFAILPLYAAAEKFDFHLLDAARDLGASAFQAVWRIFLPGIRSGISSATIIVFVCALGQYVVPQMVGGTDDEMLGNKIVQRAFSDRNLPLACALSGVLLIAVLLPTLIAAWRQPRTEDRP